MGTNNEWTRKSEEGGKLWEQTHDEVEGDKEALDEG
jgi:hypothetical protein